MSLQIEKRAREDEPPRRKKLPSEVKKPRSRVLTPPLETAPARPSRNHMPLFGGFLLAVVFPFVSLTMVSPQSTGALGQGIEAIAYDLSGQTSLLFPILVLSVALHFLLPRNRRPVQMTWAPLLLWFNLVVLAQRMGAQGGRLGAGVDGLLVNWIGPVGSWLVTLACLPLCILAVCRIPPHEAGHALANLLHAIQDGLQDGVRWLLTPAPEEKSESAEELAEDSLEESLELAPAPRAPLKPLPVGHDESVEAPESVPFDLAPPVKDGRVRPQPLQWSEPGQSLQPLRPSSSGESPVAPGLDSQELRDEVNHVLPCDDEPYAPSIVGWSQENIPVPAVAPPSEATREEPPRALRHREAPPEEKITFFPKQPSSEPTLRESGERSHKVAPLPPHVEPEPEPELEPQAPEADWQEDAEAEEDCEASLEPMAAEDSAELDEPLEPEEDFDEEAAPVVPAPQPKAKVSQELFLEPNGQLRLFPGEEKAPPPDYRLPPLALLNDLPHQANAKVPEDKSHFLLDALASFGVQATLLAIVRGPAVTRYELQPARGVKVSRFTSLTNDIALALAATAVRIEAPIPGKSAIGIEIPNECTDLVVLKEILASQRFRKSVGLSIALGKDLGGSATFANLQKMPHLLVAGTTGSGKSVCVNGLILSLLYRFSPRQLQLLMIDPKQVELSIYEGIPHLISLSRTSESKTEGAIICDPKRAALALHQIVELMEYRYGLFAAARVRNLEEFNEATDEPLPWVVVIIDELADLMMVASKSVETSICRIAQKARAAGIHLVLATQRPSADVITGLIKVNVPSRVAFAVSSQVDSRVILDTGGAEQLLGKGDMLFCPVDASEPRRVQGCFVSNDEILRVVEWWRAQACPENLIQLQAQEVAEESGDEEEGDADDALVEQALQVVLKRRQASASLLQTELKVGYARARRLVFLMEKKGYIGPAEGSKPRKILYGGGGG